MYAVLLTIGEDFFLGFSGRQEAMAGRFPSVSTS